MNILNYPLGTALLVLTITWSLLSNARVYQYISESDLLNFILNKRLNRVNRFVFLFLTIMVLLTPLFKQLAYNYYYKSAKYVRFLKGKRKFNLELEKDACKTLINSDLQDTTKYLYLRKGAAKSLKKIAQRNEELLYLNHILYVPTLAFICKLLYDLLNR